MNVLKYLAVRAQKLNGVEVSDEDWNDVLKFEAEHPELVMNPRACDVDKDGD